jgi:hypothetical protein
VTSAATAKPEPRRLETRPAADGRLTHVGVVDPAADGIKRRDSLGLLARMAAEQELHGCSLPDTLPTSAPGQNPKKGVRANLPIR